MPKTYRIVVSDDGYVPLPIWIDFDVFQFRASLYPCRFRLYTSTLLRGRLTRRFPRFTFKIVKIHD